MRPPESFVEQPVRSLQTMLRVISEDDNSYPTVVPDGVYGPGTMNAVSAFQRKNGLPATGITDQPTWETIVEKYEPALIRIENAEPIQIIMNPGQVYRRGDASPYIYLLQSMLTQLSRDHAAITSPTHSGILDEATARSLSGFQTLAALPVTGEFDKLTWKHLVQQYQLNAHQNIAKTQTDE
ncbi:MAG: peptidoglycan-binding protein [Oscillospiraceae bacterium]|nr:peptidoglycan-binding protein [Oscillospiraceae bacterium]